MLSNIFLQVPANRIGFTTLTLPQLEILQEVITLAVFVPFAILLYAAARLAQLPRAALCMVGAVYFIFRG